MTRDVTKDIFISHAWGFDEMNRDKVIVVEL